MKFVYDVKDMNVKRRRVQRNLFTNRERLNNEENDVDIRVGGP